MSERTADEARKELREFGRQTTAEWLAERGLVASPEWKRRAWIKFGRLGWFGVWTRGRRVELDWRIGRYCVALRIPRPRGYGYFYWLSLDRKPTEAS